MWFSPPAGQAEPVQPSATKPGPLAFTFETISSQMWVAREQSLLSVKLGPFPAVAQGTQESAADHPAAVTEPSDVNLNVKQPLGLFAVYVNGTAGFPDIRPVGFTAGAFVNTGEFCVAPFPIVK